MYRTSRLLALAGIISMTVGVASAAELPLAKNQSTQIAQDNNAFAFDLYGKARVKDGNLVFSPVSISNAMTASENWSERPSTGCPCTCSGDM